MDRTAGHFTPKQIAKGHLMVEKVTTRVTDHLRHIIQNETVTVIEAVDDLHVMETC